ncbi:methionyl-tRNA formyltransferase [Calidifontibacter sp. DB0510]|uniref:Methionyl-tRNA formyltransferase n=1 Tax=Metallococcus carri TaxID=1656884 RepID=A0A967B068_9MICO|nr:methionyl-tRNA formyltransferase [Metallococcus carri]NHN55003.1 methionyl-tRNA formyltransferase [Metallococcus carri]NOP37349.1 methionyl-tRNA formyltransferase [Calidifontibacter sp. DB2511S]
MRVVFAGTPEAAVPSLRALLGSRHEVVGVVTRPDAPAGRGRSLRPSPVRVVAEEAGVPVLTPQHPREPAFVAALADLRPDACPVVAYGALVPRAAREVPRHGWINLHFSLLPAWRGAAPVQHALLHGDEVTGATTFVLDQGMDTGPVLGTMTEPIGPSDTAGELLGRLASAGAGLLVATLDGLEDGSVQAVPQPADGVSMAPKIEVADAEIRWHEPGFAVDRRIRACTPAPGAWTTFRGARLKVLAARPAPDDGLAAGQLRVGKQQVVVGAGSGAVELLQVQPHGRKAVTGADWARGARIEDEERLGG